MLSGITMNIKTITEKELLEDLEYWLDNLSVPVKIIATNPDDEPVMMIPYDKYVAMKEMEADNE